MTVLIQMKNKVLMKYLPFIFLLFLSGCKEKSIKISKTKVPYAIVIHGGAGVIKKENFSVEKEASYRQALNEALDIGENILKLGGSSTDAVVKTIMFLEDSPLFNAGKGAVFTNDGTNKLDASIMDGSDKNAGAVGGVSVVKNPITAALAVMNNSPHVMLSGNGADEFAKEQGLEIVPPQYFKTESRWNSLQKALNKEKRIKAEKYGTVGCVALDKNGNIVAGTSTGGMTNKKYDRIGDSPIIGAGTYADNNTCGVSSTGHGEFFIRFTVARDIAAIMEYKGSSLQEAANYIVNEKLVEEGGDGGIVALDKYGNISMPFNTAGMYRGYSKPDKRVVKIFND